MKFNPVNSNFVFEPITTPNKNIQSYFMRSEQSFFTPERFKYPSYPSQDAPIQLLLLDGIFQIDGVEIEQDFLMNGKMNIEKYKSIQKCIDSIYGLIYNELKTHNSDNIKKRMVPVQLIISDFLGRSDTIALVDVVLNMLGFKAIMILPISICLSLHLNQNYSAFIYKSGFSFIDDFCLINTYEVSETNSTYPKTRLDDEDFAEEYSRLSIIEENLNFSCDCCSQKEDTEEKITNHITKEHQTGTYFKYEKTDDFASNFNNRMRYLFNKEKYQKVSKKIYSIETDFEDALKIENGREMAILGAQFFFNLDSSKDLWMTDHEWRNARLRVLKEKLLFYI
jgi:hypothetical protein